MRTIRITAVALGIAALLYGACVAMLCCCGELPDVPDMGPWHE